MTNKRYEFRRLNNELSHPFYISDVGPSQQSNTLTFSEVSQSVDHQQGIAGSQSFIVDLNNYPVGSPIYYYCTSHLEMNAQFTYEEYIEPTILYVSGGSGTAPYYQFYSDSAGINEVSVLYLENKRYEFRRLNNQTNHPFYISDVGYGQESNTLTFIGDGNHNTGITGSESFIVNLNNYPVDSSIHYYCTAHSGTHTQFYYAALIPITIYVSGGSETAPYYQFYSDSAGINEVSVLYLSNVSYEFRRLNNATSHPFYISDVGYGQESNTLTFIGDGNHNTGITGSESFIMVFNNYPVGSSIHYYCTAHSGIVYTIHL